jgi:hypothetical protein
MDRISSGPASAANIHIFTCTAFAFVTFEISQFPEEFGILPDVSE